MPDHPFKVRLGRKPNKPDDRDWTPDKLHAKLGVEHQTPPAPDSVLDKTPREAIAEGDPFYTTWAGIRALWALIKSILHPRPKPTPSADGPLWDDPVLLDQGDYGTCVGNAWAGFLACPPIEDPNVDETLARAIYYEATCIGGFCDASGQDGSSTRDGVKAVKARGRVGAYAFASTTAGIDEWLHNHGPVIVGTDWYNGSFDIDSQGFINLTGGVAGGHEYILLQDLASQNAYLAQNSWDGWGIDNSGRFKIRKADMATLQSNGGDACLAAELPL